MESIETSDISWHQQPGPYILSTGWSWRIILAPVVIFLTTVIVFTKTELLTMLLNVLRPRTISPPDQKKQAEENSTKQIKDNKESEKEVAAFIPLSVNYHFTRKCNYSCGFCFHTAKTSFHLQLEDAQRGLRMLKDAGMQKVNFSGGEPFIIQKGHHLGLMVRYCKEILQLESVSIVSNGSLIKEEWFEQYGQYVDILAVSCDSFDEETNRTIGRGQGRRNHIESLLKVRDLCLKYQVAFKINTVVNSYNQKEDMNHAIQHLNPVRWKVFQCLLIGGENSGANAIRKAEQFVISDEDFRQFCARHESVKCLVPESNEKMRNSYLILDEYMRFLDCTRGQKEPSKSLLDVGVAVALGKSGFDERMFFKRGGKYVWSKGDLSLDW